jgi:hypothetical protein
MAAVSTSLPVAGAGLPLLFAQAGQALVAPGLDQAAKPVNPVANLPGAKMAENFANAPAGGAAPAAATTTAAAAPAAGSTQAKLIKYAPSYVLMLLLIGLGLFIICRPYSIAEDKIE